MDVVVPETIVLLIMYKAGLSYEQVCLSYCLCLSVWVYVYIHIIIG